MMNRRGFLTMGAGLAGGAVLSPRPGHGAPKEGNGGSGSTFRSIAYNVYGCKGWPERTGNRARLAAAQPLLPKRLALELALYAPDVVTISEAPDEEGIQLIASELGMGHTFFPSPEAFPGAVLSRFPITESTNCPLAENALRPGDCFTRHFGRAVLEAGFGKLVVYSAHLHPSSRAIRLREIALATAAMRGDMEAGHALLLQGDLNHRPKHPEYQAWTASGLADTFTLGKTYRAPADDGATPPGTVSSIKPGARIDYIWTHGPLTQHVTDCRALYEGAFRTHRDDPTSFALSDHLPVMAEFRWP